MGFGEYANLLLNYLEMFLCKDYTNREKKKQAAS